jgi:hypothetical protein
VRNGVLIADSCASPAACTAVGVRENSAGTDVTLAERWNGTSWRIQATRGPAGASYADLAAVSCSSARACTAVASSQLRARIRMFALVRDMHWARRPGQGPA